MLRWMPSAMWPRSVSCVRIYVKWRNTGVKQMTVGFYKGSKLSTHVRYPDRELLVVWRPEDYPPAGEWDELHDFSPFEPNTIGSRSLSEVLISAHTTQDKTAMRDMERARPGSDIADMTTWNFSGVKVYGDSGGAQLTSGKTNWVDPLQVINFYNGGVDIGMAVDVPPRVVDQGHPKVIHACAVAQRQNNAIFEAERSERVKLFNVAHGFDLDQIRRFIDTVSDDGKYTWDGWGVGSGAWMEVALVRNLITVIKEAPWKKKKKKHVHLFAVAGPQRLPYYAYIGKHIDSLTVDSTHWLQGIKYCRYLSVSPAGKLTLYPLGRERVKQKYMDAEVTPVPGSGLPCACPVCSLFPSWDAFGAPSEYRLYVLLAWHNIFVMKQLTEMWANLAQNVSSDEYRDWLTYINGDNGHFILDFIDNAMAGSIEAAEHKESIFFGLQTLSLGEAHAIFPGGKKEDPNDPHTQLGDSNMLAVDLPSVATTVLPNYLTREQFKELGLAWHPESRDRKRNLNKQKPRKRYKYQPRSKQLYIDAIAEWSAENPKVEIPEFANNKQRIEFCRTHGVPLPKMDKTGEVIVVTDEEADAIEEKRKSDQGVRYRKTKVKRAIKKKRAPKKPKGGGAA